VAQNPKPGDRIIFPQGLPVTIQSVDGETVTYYGNRGTFPVPAGKLRHAPEIGPEWWRAEAGLQRDDETK
jgi:hypothetical protein